MDTLKHQAGYNTTYDIAVYIYVYIKNTVKSLFMGVS